MRAYALAATSILLLYAGVPLGGQEKAAVGRWEKSIEAFERQDQERPPPKNGVVFVGSSSIRFWDLRKSFPDLDAINRGFGGSELADSVHYVPRIVVKYQPRLVILYAGDNDLGAGKSPEKVFADFKDFVNAVHTPLPRTKIAFISIKPSILRWKIVDRMRKANALIEEYCKQNQGLVFIDVSTPMLGADGKPRRELFRNDGLHLNDKGYELWASLVKPVITAARAQPAAGITPLIHAHAHNDYEHPHPLFDALSHGFCSIEADIFLRANQLLVGHSPQRLHDDRTLERLYLDPLRERVRANHGRVYPGGPTIYLLIDVKTKAETTWPALNAVLDRYGDMLSVTRHGKFEANAVTVVVTGTISDSNAKATRDVIAAQDVRYVGIDGRPRDLDSNLPSHLMPWISERWGAIFRWRGEGQMPQEEWSKLQDYVVKAHEHGRLVRFWATPENPDFWQRLLFANVDLINTDQLAELHRFLPRAEAPRSTGIGVGPSLPSKDGRDR
jgi:lysophospholipase L1-like esterase